MSFRDRSIFIQNKQYYNKSELFYPTSNETNQSSYSSIPKFDSNQILKNTQFLTQFQNYLTHNLLYKQVKVSDLYANLDISSLCKLIVQNMYLLQIGYIFGLRLFISQQLYVQKAKYSTNSHNYSIFRLFCFQNQLNQKTLEINTKRMIINKKFHKIFQHQSDKLQDFFFILQKLVNIVEEYFQFLKNNQKQTLTVSQNIQNADLQINRRYLVQLVKMYRKIILPQKKRFKDSKILLKFLQHSKLFRTHGILVKIINISLFYSIRNSKSQIKEQLFSSIQHLKTLYNRNQQQLSFKQKQIQKYIDYVFGYLCLANLIQITRSLKTTIQEQKYLQFEALSLFEYQEDSIPLCPVMTATLLVPQNKYFSICPNLLQRILEGESLQKCQQQKEFQKPKNLQIEVSYTFLKNQIKVRCLTQIEIKIDNMDYINYLVALFNEGADSTINIDTIDKFHKSASKGKEKIIVFKLSSRLNYNQQPLTKMLQSIDVSMLAAKIFMNELAKRSFIKLQDYKKKQRICEIYKHYENIFRKVMEKFYSQMENAQKQTKV